MADQIYIANGNRGEDITAKLIISEALKNCGYTVFSDYDLQSKPDFSKVDRIIKNCNDFIIILTPNCLDGCVNDGDFLYHEISQALAENKNIIPIVIPGFSFSHNLPGAIARIQSFDPIHFSIPYFDSMMTALKAKLISTPDQANVTAPCQNPPKQTSAPIGSRGLEFALNANGSSYSLVSKGTCRDKNVVIPDSYNKKPVTAIRKNAFNDCYFIKSVTIPSCVAEIGDSAFRNCSSLSSISLPHSITFIGDSVFAECSDLSSVVIPPSVTYIGTAAFRNCKSLTQIDIPEGVTIIGNYAFSGCSSLFSVNIQGNLSQIGFFAFESCTSLKQINIPYGVTQIDNGVFSNCSSLSSITIPNSITVIGHAAFYGCASLISVTVPASVKVIGNSAFANCSGLKSILLPDGITCIDEQTFYCCESLTSIRIPASVNVVKTEAFRNCDSLSAIYYNGSARQWKNVNVEYNWYPAQLHAVTCYDDNCKIKTTWF